MVEVDRRVGGILMHTVGRLLRCLATHLQHSIRTMAAAVGLLYLAATVLVDPTERVVRETRQQGMGVEGAVLEGIAVPLPPVEVAAVAIPKNSLHHQAQRIRMPLVREVLEG